MQLQRREADPGTPETASQSTFAGRREPAGMHRLVPSRPWAQAGAWSSRHRPPDSRTPWYRPPRGAVTGCIAGGIADAPVYYDYGTSLYYRATSRRTRFSKWKNRSIADVSRVLGAVWARVGLLWKLASTSLRRTMPALCFTLTMGELYSGGRSAGTSRTILVMNCSGGSAAN